MSYSTMMVSKSFTGVHAVVASGAERDGSWYEAAKEDVLVPFPAPWEQLARRTFGRSMKTSPVPSSGGSRLRLLSAVEKLRNFAALTGETVVHWIGPGRRREHQTYGECAGGRRDTLKAYCRDAGKDSSSTEKDI